MFRRASNSARLTRLWQEVASLLVLYDAPGERAAPGASGDWRFSCWPV
jgi:hypothetical protein